MKRIIQIIATSALVASISFAADAQSVIGQMTPFRTYPPTGEEIPSFQGVSEVSFIFPGGGDIGVESINRQGKTVTITRDGETVATVDCTDRHAVYNPANNPSEVTISFPAIKTPGTYTVTIPQNMVTMAVDYNVAGANENEDEETEDSLAERTSKEYSIDFVIVECPEFTIDPKPGKLFPEQLYTVTLTFPEGTRIFPMPLEDTPVAFEGGENEGDTEEPAGVPDVVGLYDYNDTNYETGSPMTLLSEYDVKYEGNKVILTAKNPEAITPRRGNFYVNWEYINIPKDAWYMADDEKEYNMPAFKFEKYDVLDPVIRGFEITPKNGQDKALAPSEFESIYIKYPDTFSPASGTRKGTNVGFLRQCGVTEEMAEATSGYVFGFYTIENIDYANHIITAKIKNVDPLNSYCNNLEAMETGYYSFYLNGMMFDTPYGSNSAINFPGYYVKGQETTSPNNYQPENLIIKPNVVDPTTGFSYVTLGWPFQMAVENPSATAVLTLDGKEIGKVPVASLEIPETGTREMKFVFTNDFFITPGTYKLTIPAGTFRQLNYGTYPSAEIDYDILLPGELKFTTVPEGGEKVASAKPVEQFDVLRLTYDQITTVIVFEEDVDLSVISLDLLNTAGLKVNTYHPSSISGDGNTVTLTFDPEIRLASGANNYVYRISVPGGLWYVERFDEISFNNEGRYFYRILNPVEGSINLEPEYNLDLDNEVMLIPPYAGFTYNSPVQPITDVHTFGSRAYLARETPDGYQKVWDYLIAEKRDDNNVYFDCGMDFAANRATRANVSEKYRIVIPENSVIDYAYCGVYHPEYTFDFVVNTTTSGVTDIFADGERHDVYSIEGLLLLHNADKDALSTLPRGIYIVAGEKVKI